MGIKRARTRTQTSVGGAATVQVRLASPNERPLPDRLRAALPGLQGPLLEAPNLPDLPGVGLAAALASPAAGAHFLLAESAAGDPMARARKLIRHLRTAGIGALPCRVWLLASDASPLASEMASAARAGVLRPPDLEPARLRGLLLGSVQLELGEVPAAQRRDCVWQVSRLFGERVMPPSLDAGAEQDTLPEERRLAREIAGLRASLATAEMDPHQLDARARVWTQGARMVRGVTGSGKTSVLAAATALAVDALACKARTAPAAAPRVLVTCPERSLLPALQERITGCFTARTGARRLPRWVEFRALPEVVSRVAAQLGAKPSVDATLPQRERLALDALRTAGAVPAAAACDLVVLDEAHDASDQALELLAALAEGRNPGDPRVHAYFDDAQAMAPAGAETARGLRRRWKSLGLRATGLRSVLLDQAYRTPLETLEPAFNLRLGTLRAERVADAADCVELDRLVSRGKVVLEHDGWARVQFAVRDGGRWPLVHRRNGRRAALQHAIDSATKLVRTFGLLPEDVAVLAPDLGTLEELEVLARSHTATPVRGSTDLSRTLIPVEGSRPVVACTANAARGLEWPVTILVGWEGMEVTSETRAGLYVAMTRTQHLCMLVTTRSCTLADELEACIERSRRARGNGRNQGAPA